MKKLTLEKPTGVIIKSQKEFYEKCLTDKLESFIDKMGNVIENSPRPTAIQFLEDEIERIKAGVKGCRILNNNLNHGGASDLKHEEMLWNLQLEIAEERLKNITSNIPPILDLSWGAIALICFYKEISCNDKEEAMPVIEVYKTNYTGGRSYTTLVNKFRQYRDEGLFKNISEPNTAKTLRDDLQDVLPHLNNLEKIKCLNDLNTLEGKVAEKRKS